jgi:uncharacterized membrane protein
MAKYTKAQRQVLKSKSTPKAKARTKARIEARNAKRYLATMGYDTSSVSRSEAKYQAEVLKVAGGAGDRAAREVNNYLDW